MNTENELLEEEPLVTWTITFKGEKYTEDDMLGEHLMTLAMVLGDDWRQVSPLSGPLALIYFIAIFHSHRTGCEMIEVVDELKKMKMEHILDCLEVEPA